MLLRFVAFALVVAISAQMANSANDVREIPEDWTPGGMRQLRVVHATASTALEPRYAARRAVDGNRGSKWVATTAPSTKSPQWITLKLLGLQRVNAVAVFGERIDNDGIVDAAVQVAGKAPEAFTTVAQVKGATSASWLATFEAVKTNAVRLLVTRSGGPSSHTDVCEIMVFGEPLSAEDLKANAAETLEASRKQIQSARAQATKLDPRTNPFLAEAIGDMESLGRQLEHASQKFRRWDSLAQAQHLQLAERIDTLLLCSQQATARLARVADVWSERAQDLASVRRAAEKEKPGKKVLVSRTETRTRLISDRVVLDLDQTDGTWQATWLGAVDAALRRVHFSAEVDGKEYHPADLKAEVIPVSGKLGTGQAIVQRWGDTIQIERHLQLYRGRPAVVVTATITNNTDHDVSLGTVKLLELSADDQGWWQAGRVLQTPGMVTVAGLSQLVCEPVGNCTDSIDNERSYGGTNVLALAHQDPLGALVVGFLTGLEARPDLQARFRPVDAGTTLRAQQRFLGRKLRPGATLHLDPVYVSAYTDPFEALEQYGDAVAVMTPLSVRKGPTSLWCSWYAHRMAMTEELVLANAAVAAKHFKPLGMKIIQLDHGWQRGDVTGDWIANERFPHGLKWLAEQLQARYGLRLGLWIAPTDVADVTQTFKAHPDWMLEDAQGKPRINWRWYWKPNPNCYELDASHPEAAKFMEKTFARLSAEGSSYYKIDFIAACGGERFHRHDPYCTPGWSVLRRAMEAIRKGAGPSAWIRYCQTPPLLSVGLADSAYGGADTSDSGTPNVIHTLRTNARSLAAGYWINDRLYHREVCDMSVGMRGPLWEARMKMALMGLAGCSASFSDELQYLPPSRIRMMQQCLPPGGPPMKPVDLFERTIPSVWHVHCQRDFGEWEVVGLFNFDDQPQVRTVEFTSLGLPKEAEVTAFAFWEEKFLGVYRDRLTLTLPPRTSRILFLHRLAGHPQVIGTDMHLLGGYHEIQTLAWDKDQRTLSGVCQRMPGVSGKISIYVPNSYRPHFDFPLAETSARLTHLDDAVWMKELDFRKAKVEWSIPFDGP